MIPSKEELKKIIHNHGLIYALNIAKIHSQKELFILTLADTLFENHSYEAAACCYNLITVNDRNLYKKARYQLGSMIFNFTDLADYDSPRDHARASLSYFTEAMDYLDSPDLSRRLFNCLCTGSYNMNDCPVPFPKGASVDAIFSLGDFIYSVHTKAKIKKSTYGVNFFAQSVHKTALNKAQKSIKQPQAEITRSKRTDWTITTNNQRCTRSVDDFLARLKRNGPDSFQIYFEKSSFKDSKIATLFIEVEKKSKTDYLISLKLTSYSKNDEIYNNFKKFGIDHKLTIDYGDYGKDKPITLTTANFANPAELAPYIQLCNEFDPTISVEILDDLKTACHLPLIPSKEEFQKIIQNHGLEHALKLANDCSIRNLFILSLADILFENHSYEDAASCYQLITTDDWNLYKKAQYQLGSMIFKFTDFGDYDSPRDRARASFSYFIEARDYLDSPDLLKQAFNCLCTGSNVLKGLPAPIPTGASVSSFLLLGDYIYSVQKKSNLIDEEAESEKSFSAICLGK